MREIGKVIKTHGKSADVEIDKKDECSKCGLCVFPKGASKTVISANNGINAKVGDTVTIETQKEGKFLSAMLVFLVPLLLIGLAVLINYLFINVEIWMLILSVIFIVLWYTILAIIDKKFKDKGNFSPKIVSIYNMEIIDENDKGSNE